MEHLTQSRKAAKRRRGKEKEEEGKEKPLCPLSSSLPLLLFAALRLCVK
jgi:hypothetical protein